MTTVGAAYSSNCTFMELKYDGHLWKPVQLGFKLYLYGIEIVEELSHQEGGIWFKLYLYGIEIR